MPPFSLLWTAVLIAIPLGVILHTVAILILLERWISAWIQDRLGPNRVGPYGLLQPFVDGIKLLIKEDIVPDHVDKLFFIAAPGIATATALLAFAVVPYGPTVAPPGPQPTMALYEQEQAKYQAAFEAGNRLIIAPGIDIGVLFAFAVTSLAVYGIILGGWSSNNKYSMLGSLRSSAQLISYEIPLGMSILAIILFSGSLNLERIIQDQVEHGWNIMYQPLAFLIFLTGAFAECNRLPFDLPECESELVGGYHTEYSAIKWALFFLGEYTHMITTSFLLSILFFGGWDIPGVIGVGGVFGWLLKLASILFKAGVFIGLYMVIRWTLPRFRFDQLMTVAWKVLIPLSTLNVLGAMFVREFNCSRWWMLGISIALFLGAGLIDLIATRQTLGRLPSLKTRGMRPKLTVPVGSVHH